MSKKWIRPPETMGEDDFRDWIEGGLIGLAIVLVMVVVLVVFGMKGWFGL